MRERKVACCSGLCNGTAVPVKMRMENCGRVVAACMLSACTTAHRIERPTTSRDLRPIVEEAEGRSVDIKLQSGESMAVGGLHSEGDAIAWSSPLPSSAPVADLRQATITRRGKGFLEGLAIGAGTGFVTGFATGVFWNTTCSAGPLIDGGHPQSSCPFSIGRSLSGALQLGAILGGLFSVPGAIVGGIIGAVRGDRTTFTVDASQQRP